MSFSIVGEITAIETIAAGTGVRSRRKLSKRYGTGRWRKCKGIAKVWIMAKGGLRIAEIHWYEAHGIGRKDFKIKRFLD